jgi:branched-chain amino acid transport system permease protein
MSTVQDSVSQAPAVTAPSPPKSMTVGSTATLVVLALLLITPHVREELRDLPDHDGADLRHRHPGSQSAHRLAAASSRSATSAFYAVGAYTAAS